MSHDQENIGSVIAKLIALSGGAIAGILLTNWFEKALAERAQQKSEYDRSRYAQGLTPLSPQASSLNRDVTNLPRIIKVEENPPEEQAGKDHTA